MSNLTRREWNKLVVAGAFGAALPLTSFGNTTKPNSKFNGVQIGVQSYSFRDRSLDEAIKGMTEVGINSCELWQGHVEPKDLPRGKEGREELRKWRLSVPLDTFRQVRRKFDDAGIDLYAYNLSFKNDFTEEEIERGFEMAKALGVKAITASSTVDAAKRIDQYASKHKIPVGMHNHSNIKNPNEFATPESFALAMHGASKYIAVNLDIGHYTASNYNPLDYLREHQDRIVTLHIKDRKRDDGGNVVFGEGDTPIKEVLTFMRERKIAIPANIEYEYKGADTIAEMKRCLNYCKQALGA